MRTAAWKFATPFLFFVLATTAFAQAPATSSPGSFDTVSTVEGRCPTFSWGSVEAATGYELLVFEFEEGRFDSERKPTVRMTLPGTVLSWTPAMEACLEAGAGYGWTIRALHREADGPWSRVRLFEVPPIAAGGELEQALGVVLEYLRTRHPRLSGSPGDGGRRPAPTGQPEELIPPPPPEPIIHEVFGLSAERVSDVYFRIPVGIEGFGSGSSSDAFGVVGRAEVPSGAGTAWGGYFLAHAGQPENQAVAVYGKATEEDSGTRAWAGYFDGDFKTTGYTYIDRLEIVDLTPQASPHVLCSQGSTRGRVVVCSSSRRLKTGIEGLRLRGMETIRRLRPVEFTWKHTGERDRGFVAEEVAEIDPELVSYGADGEVLDVRYRQLTALLVKALQEQQACADSGRLGRDGR